MAASKSKANDTNVKAPSVEYMLSITDISEHLIGPLTRNNDQYWTLRGAVIAQIVKDGAFSAYAHRTPNERTPIHDVPSIQDIEDSCSPYKDGMDSTLESMPVNEFAGKKPRQDLIRDLINNPSADPDKLDVLAEHIKARAIQEFCQYQAGKAIGTRSGGSTGIRNRVARGAAVLEEMDESWDNAFISKAARFVLDTLMKNDFTDEDRANRRFLLGVLEGKPASNESVTPLKVAL